MSRINFYGPKYVAIDWLELLMSRTNFDGPKNVAIDWLELPMSRTNFDGPKYVRAIEIRLCIKKKGLLH